MTYKRFGAYSSSVNPDKLAATVSGLLKLIGGAAGFVVMMGLISATDGTALVQNVEGLLTAITTIVTAGYAAYGAAQAVFGIFRKIVVAYSTR